MIRMMIRVMSMKSDYNHHESAIGLMPWVLSINIKEMQPTSYERGKVQNWLEIDSSWPLCFHSPKTGWWYSKWSYLSSSALTLVALMFSVEHVENFRIIQKGQNLCLPLRRYTNHQLSATLAIATILSQQHYLRQATNIHIHGDYNFVGERYVPQWVSGLCWSRWSTWKWT